MTSFSLCGFVALTKSSQSFIIPYFNSKQSNYNYAQELDKEFKIASFLRFRPENYRILRCRTPQYSKITGDDGVLAFQISEDKVITGNYEEILRQLQDLELAKFSPFFRIEAYSLLGNDELLHLSNCEAANLFKEANHTDFWIAASQHLARKSLAQRYNIPTSKLQEQEALDKVISRLLENPSDEDWYNEWKRHWSASKGSIRLAKVAFWWVDKTKNSEPYLPYILEDILIRFKDHEEAKSNAAHWLSQGKYHSEQWPKLWELFHSRGGVEEPLFSHGLSFLEHKLKSDDPDDMELYWASIWNKLWGEKRHITFMVGLAQSATKILGKSEVFVNKVLASALDSNRLDHSILDTLNTWLRTSENHSKVWEKVFQYFFNDSTYRIATEKFAYKILNTHPNSAHWYFILVYLAQNRFSEELANIAKNWTRTQSKNSAKWQDIMLLILKSSYADDDDRALAEKVTRYKDHYKNEKQFHKLIDYLDSDLRL